MILLIDIGNTRVKTCVFEQDAFSSITSFDHAVLTAQYLTQHFSDVTKVLVASVNSAQLIGVIEAWARTCNISMVEVETEAQAFGVKCAYSQYQHLGVDRWLALLGAHKLYPNQNLLVVDAGTALTIDVLNDRGLHLGGWIQPGVQLAHKAILQGTTKVFGEREEFTQLDFGCDTTAGLHNGCWASAIGSIRIAIDMLKPTYSNLQLVLTGGDGQALAAYYANNSVYHQRLVFHGLSRYLNR